MREQIIETSLQQFLRHGVRKTTVKKLITPLGISTKTFYKYFEDKEDILRHCLIRHYTDLFSRLGSLQRETRDPLTALVELWHEVFALDFGVNHIFYHDLNYYYPQLQDAVLSQYTKRSIKFFSQLSSGCIRMGYFRKEIIPELVPQVISILYSAITRTGELKQFRLSPDELMQNTVDAYIRGLCTEKGLKTFNKII